MLVVPGDRERFSDVVGYRQCLTPAVDCGGRGYDVGGLWRTSDNRRRPCGGVLTAN